MAEQKKQGGNAFVNSLSKGMSKDTAAATQPEATYRWALNAINESEQGEFGFLVNEEGNFKCGQVAKDLQNDDWAVIGGLYIENDEVVVFMAPKNPADFGKGRLVRVYPDCTSEVILTANCLNFRITHQIQAIYRVRKGCETNLYFTDDLNDIRHINLDALTDYLRDGFTQADIDAGTNDAMWDCENMKIWPDYDMPSINFVEYNEGGTLPAGSYQFAVQYLDQDYNPTNWTDLTQAVPVYRDPVTNSVLQIKGSKAGTINDDGSVNWNQTSKAIVLRFGNLDTSFSYLRIAVWPSTGGLGENLEGGRLVDEISISGTELFYTFAGYDITETSFIHRDELTVPKKIYQRAKTIEQSENRLLLGNLSANDLPHVEFTRNALNIQVNYVTKALSAEDAMTDGVQSGSYYFDYRSYMRDEVYAFGIVWVMKDGSESPVYHIPGRAKDLDPTGAVIPNASYNWHNRPNATAGQWDSTVLYAAGANTVDDMNVNAYTPDTVTRDGSIERWEIYNTAINTSRGVETHTPAGLDTAVSKWTNRGWCAYWECRTSRYPATLDCDGVPIFPVESGSVATGDLVMAKVRHHKMPDTTLEPHQYGDASIRHSNLHNLSNNPIGNGSQPWINTLGVEFSNIQCPPEVADQVQGYKIVKAIQNSQDKSVLDKGIVYYIHGAMMTWLCQDSGGNYPGQCAYYMQGNMRNKHISQMACTHFLFDEVDYDDMNKDASSFWNSADGKTCIAMGQGGHGNARGIHGSQMNFDSRNNPVYNGYTLNLRGSMANCSICDADNGGYLWDGKRTALMAPMINYESAGSHSNCGQQGDMPSVGDGFPHWMWGTWVRDPDSGAVYSYDEGLNVGLLTDVNVYLNAVVGYHGPLSKFARIDNASYMKVERVLQGYNVLINCNNSCCNNDMGGTHTTGGDASGVGSYVDGRDDDHSLWVMTKCTYHHSAIPYSQIDTGMQTQYASFGTGSQGRRAWSPGTRPHDTGANFPSLTEYQTSLTNVRIEDFVFFEADSGEHFVPTFGDAPFNMWGQQEVMPLVFKRLLGQEKSYWRLPWPGNNLYTTGGQGNVISRVGDAWTSVHCQVLETNENGTSSGGNVPSDMGHEFDGRSSVYYVSLKKYSYDAYGNLGSLLYIPTNSNICQLNAAGALAVQTSDIIFGGDTFISRFAFKQTNDNKLCGTDIWRGDWEECYDKNHDWYARTGGNNTVKERCRDSSSKQARRGVFNHVNWYWTESYINTELRCGTDVIEEMFYPYHFEGGDFGLMTFLDDIGMYDRGPVWDYDIHAENHGGVMWAANSYIMNKDYHKLNNENIFVPLPLQFDYCSACHEDFPYRIAYSEQGFQEEQRDLFKAFLTNNYRDIPAHRGEIWNMWTLDNAIFVHTKESLWRVDPSRNVMSPADGERSIYIGTGDFFSSPPKEILQSETGYLGCQSQWGTQKTESGVFWPDPVQGHIFMMQQNPKDIAMAGMRNWFEENMEIEIYKQYQTIYQEPFPFIDNPANPAGAGYVSTYDQRHSRFIVTKKDYKLVSPWDTTNSNSAYYQVISADPYTGNWVVSGGPGAVCNCVPNINWLNYDNYSVVNAVNPATGQDECQHTWDQTIEETFTLASDTDIWVFYDSTSMSDAAAAAANASVVDWVNSQQNGGVLTNWAGNLFHVTMGDERWVMWPRAAAGNNPGIVTNAYGHDVYPSAGLGNYVSPNTLCLVLHDESQGPQSTAYHDASPGSPYGGEKTSGWNADYASYVATYNSYTSLGAEMSNLIYPVCSNMNGAREVFVLHAFSAVYGSLGGASSSIPTGSNSFGAGRPDTTTGNSLQTGVPANRQVDLLPALTGANPYAVDTPLKSLGWDGRWDKRDTADFNNMGDDISQFVADQTYTVVTTTDFEQWTGCIYEDVFGGSAAPCGCEDTLTTPIDITLNDTSVASITKLSDIFECKSWTASYNIGTNTWISFHSYMPNYYVGARNFFYSGLNYLSTSTHLWRHGLDSNKGNFQTYYECLYPHVIDIISNDSPLIVNDYSSFRFVTDAEIWSSPNQQWMDLRGHTFDKAIIYNSYQTSGEQAFTVVGSANPLQYSNALDNSIGDNSGTVRLQRTERTWKANGFRDLAENRVNTGVALWSSNWANLAAVPYMDKVVNPAAVNNLKTWTDQARFTDKYLGIRLIFSNLVSPGNVKLTTNYVQSSAAVSTR